MVRAPFEGYILEIIVSVVVFSALGSGYYQLLKPDWVDKNRSLHIICNTTLPWFLMRLLGAVFAIMVYFQVGPEIVWTKSNGFTVFNEIGATVFFIVSVACFLMPFLTEFGFMEFIGAIVSRPFKFLFLLPGRSAIDALASFLTASTVGLLITIGQYERGYYTTRQAASVAVNFSVVSISFSLLIATVAGIEHLFFNWYISVFIACVLCAAILVRIPPLSRLTDDYLTDNTHPTSDQNASLKSAISLAVERAKNSPSPLQIIINSWHSSIGVVFGVIAPSMAIGTLTIILLNHTALFDILSYPIYMVLDLLNFPDGSTAAPGMIIGFLDQFMPAIVASNIENELVKFVLAGLAVTQLIYMSEVGLIILRSPIPLSFIQLFIIFIMRTIISFPVLFIAGLIII
jgi:nucleoside recognition membrane protein YjiH